MEPNPACSRPRSQFDTAGVASRTYPHASTVSAARPQLAERGPAYRRIVLMITPVSRKASEPGIKTALTNLSTVRNGLVDLSCHSLWNFLRRLDRPGEWRRRGLSPHPFHDHDAGHQCRGPGPDGVYTGGFSPQDSASPAARYLATGCIIPRVPNSVLCWLAVGAAAVFIMTRTTLGRCIYAIGNSERAVYLSGIDMRRVVMIVFAISGGLAALGGVLLAGRPQRPTRPWVTPICCRPSPPSCWVALNVLAAAAAIIGTVAGVILITLLQSILSVITAAVLCRLGFRMLAVFRQIVYRHRHHQACFCYTGANACNAEYGGFRDSQNACLVARVFVPDVGPCVARVDGESLVDVTASFPTCAISAKRESGGCRARRQGKTCSAKSPIS